MEDSKYNRGTHFRLSWIRDAYVSLVEHAMYEAPRYICCILFDARFFADKSHVYIDGRYITLFTGLGFHKWAQGCAVLTFFYHSLGETTTFETRQLAY